MFQLGAISDELSPNFRRALDMASQLGIDQVELHTANGRTIEFWADDQVATVKEALQRRGLSVCCISSTVFLRCSLDDPHKPIPSLPGFKSISGEYRDHLIALQRCLDIAQILDAPLVRIFGFWRDGPTLEETYDRAADKISEALEMAAASGIKLALENCPHTYFDWGVRAGELAERINSKWLGVLWDPCSGLRSGEPDYLAAIQTFARLLVHMHAKDMLMDVNLKKGRRYVPIGQGQIDWMEIFQHLKQISFEGVVCLETHHNGPDGTRESAAFASFNGLRHVHEQVVTEKEGY